MNITTPLELSAMRKIPKIIQTALSIAILSGCTADLVVFDGVQDASGEWAPGNELPGIPVALPQIYVLDRVFTADSNGRPNCNRTFAPPLFQTVPRDLVYVGVRTGIFADSEFTIHLTENGIIQEISLNSNSNLPETLDSTAGLVSAVGALPILGAGESNIVNGCTTSPIVCEMRPLNEYMAHPSPNPNNTSPSGCTSS